MSKTISFSVPDEVYEEYQRAYKKSGETFFSDYIKKLFFVEELFKLKAVNIKVSRKDADVVSYILLISVLIEILKRKVRDKANIKSLPKHKKEMYRFIDDFMSVSFMRIAELNSAINEEMNKSFGKEYEYYTNILVITIGKMINHFADRPVKVKQIEEFVENLARRG